jgi:hypothetical protein
MWRARTELGHEIIIDIPKYEEYEEIHTYIRDKDEVVPIAHRSNIVKGITENRQFVWLGYVFSNEIDRGEIVKLADDYFRENRVGLSAY